YLPDYRPQLPGGPAGERRPGGDPFQSPHWRPGGCRRGGVAGTARPGGRRPAHCRARLGGAGCPGAPDCPGDQQRVVPGAPGPGGGPQRRRWVAAGDPGFPRFPGVAVHARNHGLDWMDMTQERATWRDYLELTKPNVVALMILTSLIGMFLAVPGMVPLDILVLGNLGIALCAGSAAAVNHLVDRGIDLRMARTFNRPVATGRIEPLHAVVFAAVLGLLGMAILLVYVNALTAWLTLASLLGYAVIYTLFLKRATPQNIVIGGLAGAAPPLLGWTAVSGEIHGHALLLVLIIFAWTPPHFWALAVHRKDE